MRHERNHHVRLRFFPVRFEHANRGPVINADRELQYSQELRAAKSPAVAQHQVVGVLNPDAGVLPQDVNRVEQFLKVCKLNFPRTLLRPDRHFQRRCSRPVAAPGVKKSELDSLHAPRILAFAGPWIATVVLKQTICVERVKYLCFQNFSGCVILL